jgi:N4-gp56 family major capsid protein
LNPADKIIIMDQKTYYAMMKQADFKDAAKNGKQSTIYSGAITNIAGSDLFVTDLIPLTGATGKVLVSGNTKGTIIVCDVTVLQHGSFGEIRSNNEVDFAVSQLLEAAGYWGMNNINGKDSKNFVAVGYNCS